MAYFPAFLKIEENDRCVIIGGGSVAERKLDVLLSFTENIDVVAEHLGEGVQGKARSHPSVRLFTERYQARCLDREAYDLAVAATNDTEVNRQIRDDCRERGILFNAVDDPKGSDFIFPAIVKRGDLTVGISTGGSCPAVTQYYKEEIASLLPDNAEELLERISQRRQQLKDENIPYDRRRELLLKEWKGYLK